MASFALITPNDTQVRTPDKPLRIAGIDLGTTNSAIAEIIVHPGDKTLPDVRCIEVEQDTIRGLYTHTLVPSVVAFHDGKLYVGEGARELRPRLKEFGLVRNKDIFWDCKNDIGVRRTYHKAPEGFRSASDIGGHVLKSLMDAVLTDESMPVETTVVTVPASFQVAQRVDTRKAAEIAGIRIMEGGLLDEPVAAFLDYLVTHGRQVFAEVSSPQKLAVFDFGGGTCDVAVFQLLPPGSGQPIRIAPLAVSRYHRLGGGDIDRAITVDVLLPQLMAQNEIAPDVIDYRAKSEFLIPALLGAAESLKTGLCKEITRLKKLGRYDEERRSGLVQKNPGSYPCRLPDGKDIRLQSPTLSATEFDKVLKHFLDRDLLYPRESDYLMTCSIFAPLQDALERAHLDNDDIDFCLMVGGSSLIPQVAEAVSDFFRGAQFLHFEDAERIQTAAAHGAAYQALSLALYDQGIVQTVTSDNISIETSNGPVELVRAGVKLPFPSAEDWKENNSLIVPETVFMSKKQIRVELLNSGGKNLMSGLWTIHETANKGEPIQLRYRMDENQILDIRLSLADKPEQMEFEGRIENPFTSVVNPNAERDEILELEEQMRTGQLGQEDKRETVKKIAGLEEKLGNYEKALNYLGELNRQRNDTNTLNRMGIISGKMHDYRRQEKFYREAARISPHWNGPLFNLALSQKNQGKFQTAMQTIDEAIAVEPDPPAVVLKARLADSLGQTEQRNALLAEAFENYDKPSELDDYELSWYLIGAELAGDEGRIQSAKDEQHRRKNTKGKTPDVGILPDKADEIMKSER